MNVSAETYLDHKFARFLAERSKLQGEEKETFYSTVSRLSSSMREGHSCLQVNGLEKQILGNTDLVLQVGEQESEEVRPLVLSGNNLYLQKYYSYERRLAEQVAELAAARNSPDLIKEHLESLFPGETIESSDQMKAAVTAMERSFLVVNGGPGTGKTTTVVKMLALLLLHQDQGLRIALAAPTGKASMRLSESVAGALTYLDLPSDVQESIPGTALTLHRLLGVKKHSPQFRHNHYNPLPYDVVVVDEASMVDLAMMSKLVDAMKAGTRLILLGDKDQLASVESGAVLADFIESLPESSVELQKTYRFDYNIKALATSINTADHSSVWEQITAGVENVSHLLETDLSSYIAKKYGEYLSFVQGGPPADEARIKEIFTRFNKFQVLCGESYTEFGVNNVNKVVERRLALAGFNCKHGDWYNGRPVLITQNDYGLNLYNGDIGICLWDRQLSGYRVWFERGEGKVTSCVPSLLPTHETVYAMTIHKSQGSEFEEVLIVLPKEDNRVLSRELIYTAVTRAKKAVTIMGEASVIRSALLRQHQRQSGLHQMIQQESKRRNPS